MHLVVPFASDLSEACRHVLQDLALPNLEKLLARLAPSGRDDGNASTFSPPHERAIATARRWHGDDGALPFAAHAAAADGVDVGDAAWALLTPSHWQLGRDHVTLLDPDALALDEAESRALFAAVHELLAGDGFRAVWGAPTRWYAARDDLDGLGTASLDRVINRDVDLWLRAARPGGSAPRASVAVVRRLQSEVQLLLHTHAVNEAREERGALSVNSFWLSGCGRAQEVAGHESLVVANELRASLLNADWAAWAEAWRALDGSAIADLLARARAGEASTLTLCGERSWARFTARPMTLARSLWEQLRSAWQKPAVHALLQSL